MSPRRAGPAATSLAVALALVLWPNASCTTAALTSVKSPVPQPAIPRLLVIVRNDRFESEGRRVRRAVERDLSRRKVANRCIYVPSELDPTWVDAEIQRFKPAGILVIEFVGIINTTRGDRLKTQYNASLSAVATPEQRIWRAKVEAKEGVITSPEDRSDEVAEWIVEQLARDHLLAQGE